MINSKFVLRTKIAPLVRWNPVTHLAEGQRAVRILGDDEGIVASLEHRLQVIHVHHRHHYVREGWGVGAVTHPHPQRKLGKHGRNEAKTPHYTLQQHCILIAAGGYKDLSESLTVDDTGQLVRILTDPGNPRFGDSGLSSEQRIR